MLYVLIMCLFTYMCGKYGLVKAFLLDLRHLLGKCSYVFYQAHLDLGVGT